MQTVVAATIERDTYLADLESLWTCLDVVLDGLEQSDWLRKHGPDWVVADLPYHLAYFDREVIARPLQLRADMPAGDCWLMGCLRDIDAWNAVHFAKRAPGQTPEQSIAEMRAARDAVRLAIHSLNDGDLGGVAWSPFGGWVALRDVLLSACAHTWSHLIELQLRLKRTEPALRPSAIHRGLGFYANFLPAMVNREQAATTNLTAVLRFSGPGGGAWTVSVADGNCTLAEGESAHPDLVMTQSPERFLGTLVKVYNPMLSMLTGKVKVRGLRKMGAFGKLFPPPAPDQQFQLFEPRMPAGDAV